jgi:hypothetical protein
MLKSLKTGVLRMIAFILRKRSQPWNRRFSKLEIKQSANSG